MTDYPTKGSIGDIFLNYEFFLEDEHSSKRVLLSPFTFIVPLSFEENLEKYEKGHETKILTVTMIALFNELSKRATITEVQIENHYKF